jgi:transcriptional regulator with XRE-family HTH domain
MWSAGDRLRKARELTGMTAGQFAALIGISRNSVAKYESSDEPPRRPMLTLWSRATNVDYGWLSNGVAGSEEPTVTKVPLKIAASATSPVLSPPRGVLAAVHSR